MTRKEFDNHSFYAGERFEVVGGWGFVGKRGALVEVDFEIGRITLDFGGTISRFPYDQIEPVKVPLPNLNHGEA